MSGPISVAGREFGGDPSAEGGSVTRCQMYLSRLTPFVQYRLAKEIGVPQRRIGEIVAGKRSITADTAARLGVFFGMEVEFWLNLQAHYDLAITREALAENLAAIQPLAAAA